MLEAAWLLAAIELNGAMISRGANVQLTDQHCTVEARVIGPALSAEEQARVRQGQWSTNASHCRFSDTDHVLRITLPQQLLANKTLTLGEPAGTMSVALLHDPMALAQSPSYASQPSAKTIPSAAFDVFLGSGLQRIGTVLASGPWLGQALHQRTSDGHTLSRITGEYIFANSAQLKAGDFRTDHGPEQSFGEFRGLLVTNRAAPLRGEGKAEAGLAIHSPSRVQFFDRNGLPVYSSDILPPGNYQVQGFGASAIPGFLEARLVDINGVSQSVALPWSADRRLLSRGQSEWEIFAGKPRLIEGDLTTPPLYAARFKHGLNQSITLGLHAQRSGDRYSSAMEISSRALPSVIASAALGQSCAALACETTWLAEARATLGKGIQVMASNSRMLSSGSIPVASNSSNVASTIYSSTHSQAAGQPIFQNTSQLSLTGAWGSKLSGSVHLANTRSDSGRAQSVQTIAASLRLSAQSNLVAQARHHLLEKDASNWSGFIGLTYHFTKERAGLGSYANFRSTPTGGSQQGVTLQANMASPGLYGPQLSLAHTQDGVSRSDGFFRYASPHGEGSLRADSLSNKLAWSASTRLWVTQEAMIFTPAGDDNLVIQQLGLEKVRIQHSGRDVQTSNAEGIAIFKKAPSWTDSTYAVDPKSIPFGVHLASHRVRMPLASNRAYLVDYRGLWSQARSWRVAAMDRLAMDGPVTAHDRLGRRVYITPDGFADIQSAEDLPLTITRQSGEKFNCTADRYLPNRTIINAETVLSCIPAAAL